MCTNRKQTWAPRYRVVGQGFLAGRANVYISGWLDVLIPYSNSQKIYICVTLLRFYLLTAGLLDFASNSVTLSAIGEPGLSLR